MRRGRLSQKLLICIWMVNGRLTKMASIIVTLEVMKRSSQTWIVMVIGQMRTETTICTIFSGFLHFTEQRNLNLNFKFIAIQYIMYIVQKKRRETIENSWNYDVSTFVMCRGVTRDIPRPWPSQGLVIPIRDGATFAAPWPQVSTRAISS